MPPRHWKSSCVFSVSCVIQLPRSNWPALIPGWFRAAMFEARDTRLVLIAHSHGRLSVAVSWWFAFFRFLFNTFHFHHPLNFNLSFLGSCPVLLFFVLSFVAFPSAVNYDLGTPASFKQAISEEGDKKLRWFAPPPPPSPSPLPLPLPGPLLRVCFSQHRSLDCGKASSATQLSSEKSWEWPKFVQ